MNLLKIVVYVLIVIVISLCHNNFCRTGAGIPVSIQRSVIDIITALTDSKIPKRYWTDLKRKLSNDEEEVSCTKISYN